MPQLGDRQNGKIFAGEDYGYQSPQSFQKLEQQGAFKTGAQAVRRLNQVVDQLTPEWMQQNIQAEQQRQQQGWKPEVMQGQDATSRLMQGISDQTNIAPELVNAGAAAVEGALTGRAGSAMVNRIRQQVQGRRILNREPVKPGETIFHGTSDEAADVIARDGFKASNKVNGVFGEGVYSTPQDYYASAYANEAKYAARNPNAEGVLFQGQIPAGQRILDVSDLNMTPEQVAKQVGAKNLSKWAADKGYDGIKFQPTGNGLDEVLMFNPKYADQAFKTGMHSTNQPFPSQGSKLKQRPTIQGKGHVPTRQSQGAGLLNNIRRQTQSKYRQ